ncbi:MAG: diguanylate cyclase [Planctomycetota bacterium]
MPAQPESKTKPSPLQLLGNRSVKRRLALGFGVLTSLLLLSGLVSLWQLNRIDAALTQIVMIEEPLEQAVLEMEIHAGETARAILHHVYTPADRFRQLALASEEKFLAYAKQYAELAETDEEQRLGEQVRTTYGDFKTVGDELMAVSADREQTLAAINREVAAIDEALANLAVAADKPNSRNRDVQTTAAFYMQIAADRTLTITEACVANHGQDTRTRLAAESRNFHENLQRFLSVEDKGANRKLLEAVSDKFALIAQHATEVALLTEQLNRLVVRFETDLRTMDQILDEVIQPIIYEETVLAAQEAMDSSRRAVALLAFFGVLGVVFGGFVGWHISRGIVRPVAKLVEGSQIICNGDREHRIEVESRDEFGHLADAFNTMIDSLNQSTDELLESQQEMERLRLSAAQREIERHAEQARTDQLTQINNRRAFDDMMSHYAEECDGTDRTFGVVLYDVDKFKHFNDTYGHPAGDAVLCGVAQALEAAFDSGDFVARFGGEEFAVLLPDCTLSETLEKADRARRAIEDSAFQHEEQTFKVTASGGVSLYASGSDIAAIIKQADNALYEAKHAGRNCVRADEPAEESVGVAS